MDFRATDASEGRVTADQERSALWDQMLARSFDPAEWFVEEDPPARDE